MDIGEAAGIYTEHAKADDYCDNKKIKPPSGDLCISKIKGKPTAAKLRGNMLDKGLREPIHPPKKNGRWDLKECNGSVFPYQTHHLIPKAHLPKHRVCVWLATNPKKKHPEYELEADTNFNTDHWRNGYFMPFASNTHQWKSTSSSTKKDQICEEMMERTGIQLHQSGHTATDYLADEKDNGMVTKGYLTMIDSFLNMIFTRTKNHVARCQVCQQQSSGKTKVQPLESVVRHMYMISQLTKGLIKGNRIFVSQRAANFYKSRL